VPLNVCAQANSRTAKTRDPDGADEITIGADGVVVDKVRMRKDDVLDFEGKLVLFQSGRSFVQVTLHETDEANQFTQPLGSVIINDTDPVGVELKQQVGEVAGALYEVWYEVV
jgi:hypothetical protein